MFFSIVFSIVAILGIATGLTLSFLCASHNFANHNIADQDVK